MLAYKYKLVFDGKGQTGDQMNRERVLFVSVLIILTLALSFFVIKSELPVTPVSVAVHDVSIVSAVVTENYDTVVVAGNNGNQVENFSVTLYCNRTVIGNQTVTRLSPGAYENLTFPSSSTNITSLPYGTYTISTVASIVPSENKTSDNVMTTTVRIGVIHDVSIVYANVDQDYNIFAVAKNEGNSVESFNVTTHCNGTSIGTQAVTGLQPAGDAILNFAWDTTSLLHGMYNVSVVASTVPNETNSADNSFSFYVGAGSLYSAADYFSFTNITTEGMVFGGNLQILTLHFDIGAVKEDANNVTLFVDGMADTVNITRIFNGTSQHVDIPFRTPYQAALNNSVYPVRMTVSAIHIDPHGPEVILLVQPLLGTSYTIGRGGAQYYAMDDWSGVIAYSGTNFTDLFEQVQNALPANAGTIHLQAGYYEGWIVINRSGITLQGQGVFSDNPLALPNGTGALPDDSPKNLMGTVLFVNVASRDGIHFAGDLTGVHISDLGIQFTQNETGNGISDDMDHNYHLSYSSIGNIMILNHDKSHYAIQMSNFVHLEFRDIWAWGGPLLNLYENMGGFQSGNTNFYNMYGYIKYDLAPIDFAQGPYPIFVHKNDSLSNVWINFLHFYRIQINCPFAQSAPDFCEFTLWDCRLSGISGLDLEGSGNGYEGNKLRMGSCYSDEFVNAYLWSMANDVDVSIASNNDGNTFETCHIAAGVVLDSCPTDVWLNCAIDGTIDWHTTAQFISLKGNYGSATLASGSSEVNVTAKFIGLNYSVSLEPDLGLKVEVVYYAPANIFTVTCIDGQPATKDIEFKWSVTAPSIS